MPMASSVTPAPGQFNILCLSTPPTACPPGHFQFLPQVCHKGWAVVTSSPVPFCLNKLKYFSRISVGHSFHISLHCNHDLCLSSQLSKGLERCRLSLLRAGQAAPHDCTLKDDLLSSCLWKYGFVKWRSTCEFVMIVMDPKIPSGVWIWGKQQYFLWVPARVVHSCVANAGNRSCSHGKNRAVYKQPASSTHLNKVGWTDSHH